MREVPILGGTASFREPGVDAIHGDTKKLIRAAGIAAASQLSEYPELFEPAREGESDDQRAERLGTRLEGMVMSIDQAMAWDNMREATVIALLKSWTLDRPLPTMKTLGGDDYADVYDALLESVGGVGATELEADFSPTKKIDTSTPTDDSGSSNGHSMADPESPLTTTPGSATAPIAGDVSTPEQ